jgi:hypothetical protein
MNIQPIHQEPTDGVAPTLLKVLEEPKQAPYQAPITRGAYYDVGISVLANDDKEVPFLTIDGTTYAYVTRTEGEAMVELLNGTAPEAASGTATAVGNEGRYREGPPLSQIGQHQWYPDIGTQGIWAVVTGMSIRETARVGRERVEELTKKRLEEELRRNADPSTMAYQ